MNCLPCPASYALPCARRCRASPVRHGSAASRAVLLSPARGDKLVDAQGNSGQLAYRLRADQVDVKDVYYDKVGHATLAGSIGAPLRWMAPTREDVAAFVLRGDQAGAARQGLEADTGAVAPSR